MLADAIKAKPAEDTRSGCGSKHHLAVGGEVTQEGETERTPRSLRDGEKVSHHYRHGVVHSGHSVSQSVCLGPGRLVGDTLPLLPSIHLHPIHLPPTYKCFFFYSHFFVVVLSAKGITVMPSSSKLSITAVPTRPVILVMAKGSGVSSFPFWSIWFNHWLKGTFLQLG